MINVVDIFAGPGGLSLGMKMLRDERGEPIFNCICAVENTHWACETLRKNFSRDIVIEGDITEQHIKDQIVAKCKGKTDLVVGGPPCQSFSMIGPRSGNPDNNKDKYKYDELYKHFIDIVDRLSPGFFLFENVKGILSKKNGDEKIIDIIIREVEAMGYTLKSENPENNEKYLLLNAADYGVPQTRERVFIIGNNLGMQNPFPPKTHFNPAIKSQRKNTGELLPYVTVREAIGDLPKLKARMTKTGIPARRFGKIEKYNKRINFGKDEIIYKRAWFGKHINNIGESGRIFMNFVREINDSALTHHVSRPQMETDILLFKGMKQGMTAKDVIESGDRKIKRLAKYIKYNMNSFTDKYRKLHWKKPSSTIFAHMQKDGNRFIHPDSFQGRTITPREAARLQSFPDSFYFEGPMSKKFQQIGNAVPPILAKAIAKAILSKWTRNHEQKKGKGGEAHEY